MRRSLSIECTDKSCRRIIYENEVTYFEELIEIATPSHLKLNALAIRHLVIVFLFIVFRTKCLAAHKNLVLCVII